MRSRRTCAPASKSRPSASLSMTSGPRRSSSRSSSSRTPTRLRAPRRTPSRRWRSSSETVKFTLEQLKDPDKIARAEKDPKSKMALVFRWYLSKSSGWANRGESERALDFQVWCGPAIGAFNDFIRGTYLDPKVAGAFHDVSEANIQLLRGAVIIKRHAQLRADPKLKGAV